MRPGLILLYSTFVSLMETHKTFVSLRRFTTQKKIDEMNFRIAAEQSEVNNVRSSVNSLHSEKMEAKRRARKIRDADADNSENAHGEGDLAAIMPKEG